VDPAARTLQRGGCDLHLQPRVFDLLLFLVEHPGEALTKERINSQVWRGGVVTDGALTRAIGELRRVLGDDARTPEYIDTVPRVGLRFAAAVSHDEPVQGADAVPVVSAPALDRPGLGANRGRWGVALGFGLGLGVVWLLAASLMRDPAAPSTGQHLVSTFPGSHRAPSFAPDAGSIALVNEFDGQRHIWVVDLPSNDARQLTFGSSADSAPQWSPQGDRILFVRAQSIWSVAAAGGEPRRVVPSAINPRWSADGLRIVFERQRQIWTADADGADQRPVKGVPEPELLLAHRSPAFSPDGATIAFFQSGGSPLGDLWVVSAAGGQARRLTFDESLGGSPVWAADGRSIVFSSQRGGSRTLWRVPASGGAPVALLQSSGDEDQPAISRDGRKLAYVSHRERHVLTVTDPASGATRDLFESRTMILAPAFSPDGRTIAYFGPVSGGDVRLFTIAATGGLPNTVTREPGEIDAMPQWSRDGKHLYFYQSKPTRSLRRIAAAGGASEPIVDGWQWSAQNGARVSPDGSLAIVTQLDDERPVATMIRDLRSGAETPFDETLDLPRWSPDGQWVAGTRAGTINTAPGDILICPRSGRPCRTLAQTGRLPVWSHDGTRVYFIRPHPQGQTLHAVAIDGGAEQQIVDLRGLDPNDSFYDVGANGAVARVRHEVGRREVWASDLPSR
jgi:Tol biopolymer transport system component/DNA-binding winged helix-turn-helix (wHTH) protein